MDSLVQVACRRPVPCRVCRLLWEGIVAAAAAAAAAAVGVDLQDRGKGLLCRRRRKERERFVVGRC
jgi:hypothetical protein